MNETGTARDERDKKRTKKKKGLLLPKVVSKINQKLYEMQDAENKKKKKKRREKKGKENDHGDIISRDIFIGRFHSSMILLRVRP